CPVFLSLSRAPLSPLFPYTTLFRSLILRVSDARHFNEHGIDHLGLVGARLRIAADADLARADALGFQQQIARFTQRRVLVVQHRDRKSTRLNSSHSQISYAVFCLKK